MAEPARTAVVEYRLAEGGLGGDDEWSFDRTAVVLGPPPPDAPVEAAGDFREFVNHHWAAAQRRQKGARGCHILLCLAADPKFQRELDQARYESALLRTGQDHDPRLLADLPVRPHLPELVAAKKVFAAVKTAAGQLSLMYWGLPDGQEPRAVYVEFAQPTAC